MPRRTREPADPASGPVAAFGFQLRALRQRAHLTYTAIALTSHYSKSAIHAVDQGHQLPSVGRLKAFVQACGEEPGSWLQHRTELAATLAASKGEPPEKVSMRDRGLPAPDPATVGTPTEYNDGLKRLREWTGLTYRQIADAGPEGFKVAPSTLCGAVTRRTLPRRALVAGFLKAIDLPEPDQQAWLDAWQAIKDGNPVTAATPPVLPTVQDLLGNPPADAIAGAPWERPHPARLVIQSSPPPENQDLALIPARIPDNDVVVVPAYQLSSSELQDWAFADGRWQEVRDWAHARGEWRDTRLLGSVFRRPLPAWVMAIAITITLSALVAVISIEINR